MVKKFVVGAAMLGILTVVHATAPPERPLAPLEKRSYIKNMTVIAHFLPGQERGAKLQMMTVGDRRYLIQGGDKSVGERAFQGGALGSCIIDVSNPAAPVVVNEKAFAGGSQIQVAYNKALSKWILMVSRATFNRKAQGLRGVEFWDITNPRQTRLLSKWSVDGGDPSRAVQGGSGPHRNYYDGGKYAYLSTAPDDRFYVNKLTRYPWIKWHWGLQILDVSDPTRPRLVANWHVPGQRIDEEAERHQWRFFDTDPDAFASLHGPVYVPQRIEDGGRYGFGSWGAFGMIVHDLSDIEHPKVVSTWAPETYVPGPAVATHSVDVTRLNRGFVIVSPEEVIPGCGEKSHDSFIVDVSTIEKPTLISTLPWPQPPKEAPYGSYCSRYGRFGPHNVPHLKAPGKPAANFTCYTYFNAGLQCYDLTDPRRPSITAYFVPEQGGGDAHQGVGPFAESSRTMDNVFIEWDRRVIYASSDSGIYVLGAEALGTPILEPRRVEEWTLPGLNAGAP